jgi:hypothetical protein
MLLIQDGRFGVPLDNVIAVAVTEFLFGLFLLFLLWPGEKQGKRLLDRWRIPEPAEDELAEAVRYLRRRRFWYPWLFLVIPLLGKAAGLGDAYANLTGILLVTVLLGGLLAELLAQRPSRGVRRDAVLMPRRLVDFVPVWALVLFGLAVVVAIVRLVLRPQWTLLALALVSATVAFVIAVLAVRRPASGGQRVDLALRHRSARVAIGLGVGLTAMVTWSSVGNLGSFVAFAVSIAALIAIVTPPHELPAVAQAG